MATTIHQLSVQDRRALIPALTAHGECPEEITAQLEDASVVRFEGYGRGFSGYCGAVTVIVWPDGPGRVSVLAKDAEGRWEMVPLYGGDEARAEVEALLEKHGGERGYWGEHPEHPRSDWKYLVANDEESGSYWSWVARQLEEVTSDVA